MLNLLEDLERDHLGLTKTSLEVSTMNLSETNVKAILYKADLNFSSVSDIVAGSNLHFKGTPPLCIWPRANSK
jgi:hypothetical protein